MNEITLQSDNKAKYIKACLPFVDVVYPADGKQEPVIKKPCPDSSTYFFL